jgi:PAS domain S-box-containing protein
MRLATKGTETENLFETLANKSPVGLCIIQDGKFCYTNPTFQSNTGYREDELLGRDSLEIVVPEDRERVRENALKMLKGKLTLPYQFRVTHKDGSIHWVIESVASVQYRGRQATLGDFIDVTERKQVEEALQTEKNKLQSLIDALEYTITIQDTEYNIIYQNEPSRIASGGDHLGEKCYRAYEGRETVCDGCPVEEAFKDGKSHTTERRTTIAGKVAFWENTANPIRDAEGRIVTCLELARDITKRKEAEQALTDELTRRRLLVDQSLDGIVVLDVDAKVVEANQRFADMLGYTLEEVRELHTWDWDKNFPPEKILEMGRNVDEKGLHLETQHHRKDGSAIDVDISINGAMFGGQKLIFCVGRDVTERKQAEESLQAEKNKLQSLIDAMEYILTIQDTEYNIIYQNEPARIDAGDRLGEKCYRAYEDSGKVCDGCPVEEAFKDGKSHTTERRVVKPSGEVVFWENTANPIRDAKGRIVSCLELSRNITEHKRAEEKLQTEKNKLQSLIDAMEDGLSIQDSDYNIIYQNEPLKEIFGDHRGEKCYRVYASKDKVCAGCPVAMAFRDGKSHTMEKEVTLPSGKVAFWEPTANPVRDAKGKIVSCLEIIRDITERKKQEQALADELTRRRLLVDQSLDGIVVLDVDAKVVEANQRFADMLGYTLEEVRELHTWDWDKKFPPEKILEMGRNVDEKGFHLETQHTRKDGSVIDVDISINAAMFGGQKLIFCVGRDVTERKQAEEALKDREESYRELADSITEVFFAMDEHLRYTYWNKASEILTGVQAKDALGKSLMEIFPDTPGTRSAEKVYRAVLRRQQPQIFVNDFDIDGRHYIFEISAYPSRDGISVFVRDITERKQAEEAIKHAAEEWRRTFDSITDAISIQDREFRILRANKAFADLFKKSPRQIIGKYCYELHRGDKPISGCPHQQTLATGKPAAAEFYESHLEKHFRESTSPIFNDKGEVVGTVHITRDITEQKQQNERLMMADRLASIGELAAGTAHELNNPLTSVIGFSQLLMEKDIPDDIREDMKLIYSEARRAADVTKNLLTFARKRAPVKQLTQINNIIEDVLKLRAYEHKLNGIQVKRRLAHDLPEIMVDSFQMQQVFLNIIINAEYFMTVAHNRGTLTINTKKHNSSMRISITDDGPGIPQENLSRIFDPFFTTKEAGKGTGLGLSICHGIVAEHGGQIYAKSQPGKGATFIVELPIKSPRPYRGTP